MKTPLFSLLFVFVLSFQVAFSSNFDIESYKLDNGLTIILNHDSNQNKVFGSVAVKAGSVNDPADATGMAHYFEHLIFNGTTNVGTVNWEAEKVHYNKIIELYEVLYNNPDSPDRDAIIKQINEESKAQAKYYQTKEQVSLLESIGATGINAGTSKDRTTYFSYFPACQSEAWLKIYANKFQNPVFRNFQAELETVYEEYNMYAEDAFDNFSTVTNKNMWEDSPYGREIIGYNEHLKNPSLKKLIEFYETWYVPENMALVIIGNFDKNVIKNQIEETFGKWEAKPLKKPLEIEKVELKKKKNIRLREMPFNYARWCFNAPYMGDEDEDKVMILSQVLSNPSKIGVLDQLETDGDVIQIGSGYSAYKHASMLFIDAIPNFDLNQMRQLTASDIDKQIFDKIDEIKKGKIDESLLKSVKDSYIMDFCLGSENHIARLYQFLDYFITGEDYQNINNRIEKIESITVDDIIEVANKYLSDTNLEVSSTTGSIKLKEMKKPEIDPVIQVDQEPSVFAKEVSKIASAVEYQPVYLDLKNDIQRHRLADKVDLYYKKNTQNDVFSLEIRYKVGTATIPTLDLAAQLMNNAGVRGNFEPHELKKRMGELGCRYRFSALENYLTVSISGREENLEEANKLISMATLMPDLDIKQFNSLLGSEMNSRKVQQNYNPNIAYAAQQYLLYGENSPFIDRPTWNDLSQVDINSLTRDFMNATKYEAIVHYYGATPFEETIERLNQSLAFAAGRLDAPEYFVRQCNQPGESTISIVNRPGIRQSSIYFMVPVTNNYTQDMVPKAQAFSLMMGGGLTNVFMEEFREYRSMAYSASAWIQTPTITGEPAFLSGFVGTQSDKTTDAIELGYTLLSDLPQKNQKAIGVRNSLTYGSSLRLPSDRYITYQIYNWEMMGFEEDPSKVFASELNNIDMDYFNNFFNEYIKDKPISVVVVGSRKDIDRKKLEEYGKVQNLNSNKLFKE
jgi:predicted Zn-dependent peptidase